MTRPQRGSRTKSTIGEKVTCNPETAASFAEISAIFSTAASSQVLPKAKGIGKMVLKP